MYMYLDKCWNVFTKNVDSRYVYCAKMYDTGYPHDGHADNAAYVVWISDVIGTTGINEMYCETKVIIYFALIMVSFHFYFMTSIVQ